MIGLLLRCWASLLYFEWVLRFGSLSRMLEVIQQQQATPFHDGCDQSVSRLCYAVDIACVFYFKQVMCLQRSAVTTILLRKHGWNAEIVVGTKIRPPESHAWVEIERSVVNDKPYVTEMYQELVRC